MPKADVETNYLKMGYPTVSSSLQFWRHRARRDETRMFTNSILNTLLSINERCVLCMG